MDLTYQVLFNLAVQEETNELYAEALNHYQIIVKNKLFQQVGKIRVNMGNIYFKTKEYNKAVKVRSLRVSRVLFSCTFTLLEALRYSVRIGSKLAAPIFR